MLKKLIFSLFSILIFFDLSSAEVRELTASEKFVKELSQQYPQVMTYLKMHEVPSNLANRLNKLFTPKIQDAFVNEDFDFLKDSGFKFFKFPQIFTHKDFSQFVFKLPFPSHFLPPYISNIKKSVLLNLSRIWLANWIKMIQNEFKVPKKQVFFMKSKYDDLAAVVVAEKKDFIENLKNIEDLQNKKKEALKKIEEITGFEDTNQFNVSDTFIIDTEFRSDLDQKLNLFENDPFQIHEDPMRLRAKL